MNNSNLEFRKIPSLKFLYEINSNGTILRNVKSKKQLKIYPSIKGYYSMVRESKVFIKDLIYECWNNTAEPNIVLYGNGVSYTCSSIDECASYINQFLPGKKSRIIYRLNQRRKNIYGFTLEYF